MYISIFPSSHYDDDGGGGDGDGGGGGGGGGSGGGDGDGGSDAGCMLLTLARDGVYLEEPRRQGGGGGHVVLPPGSRADLAVKCDRPGVYRLVSSHAVDGVQSPMTYLGKKTDVFEGEKQGREGQN